MDCVCMEFAAAGWYIGKYFRLDQAVKDLLVAIEKPCLW